jgi:hypothetical protein
MNIINLQSSFTNILKVQLFKNLAITPFMKGRHFNQNSVLQVNNPAFQGTSNSFFFFVLQNIFNY